jgi:hypothetical protein
VFDLPEELPVIAVAASGPESAKIAAELGDGLFAVEPDADLVGTWHGLGGHGPAYGEMPLAWADDEDTAVAAVLEKNAFALSGWKVMAELPNPANFESVTALVTPDQVRKQFACRCGGGPGQARPQRSRGGESGGSAAAVASATSVRPRRSPTRRSWPGSRRW